MGAAYRNRTDDLRITRTKKAVQRRPLSHSCPAHPISGSVNVHGHPGLALADALARSAAALRRAESAEPEPHVWRAADLQTACQHSGSSRSHYRCHERALSDADSADCASAEQILRRLRFYYIEKIGVLIGLGLSLTLTNSSPGAPARILPSTIRGISIARGTRPVTASVAALPATSAARTTDARRKRRRLTRDSLPAHGALDRANAKQSVPPCVGSGMLLVRRLPYAELSAWE